MGLVNLSDTSEEYNGFRSPANGHMIDLIFQVVSRAVYWVPSVMQVLMQNWLFLWEKSPEQFQDIPVHCKDIFAYKSKFLYWNNDIIT